MAHLKTGMPRKISTKQREEIDSRIERLLTSKGIVRTSVRDIDQTGSIISFSTTLEVKKCNVATKKKH